MGRIGAVFVILLLISNLYCAQCNNSETKLLVMGDSWAFFSWSNNSYNENMKRFGLSDKTAYSTPTLSVNGARANDYFSNPTRVLELTTTLNNTPSIEFIHFSLGGNDLMGTYNIANTTIQNQQYYNTLMVNIKSGIDLIHSINPDLKILIAGYDYPNFEETILNFPIPSQHPFYTRWNNMGQPTAAQINAQMAIITSIFSDSAAAWNNVEFVNNLGLIQNIYGQSTPLTVAPNGTYAAGSLTVPNGMPNYPSPTVAMNFGGTDSFHLNDNAYEHFIKRHFKEYYWEAIRNADASILASDASLNGTITDNSVSTDSLSVGLNTGIITFKTSILNSTKNIKSAAIFLNREQLTGTNLANEDITLEIKSGYYGATIQLELDDIIATSDASSVACTYGNLNEDGSWMRIDLPDNFLQYIDKSSSTQFKLKYNNAGVNNHFNFYNNINNDKQPILDISYAGFTEIDKKETFLTKIYPNPFKNELFFSSNEVIEEITIYSISGKLIDFFNDLNQLNVAIKTNYFEKGIYVVKIKTKNKLSIHKIVK